MLQDLLVKRPRRFAEDATGSKAKALGLFGKFPAPFHQVSMESRPKYDERVFTGASSFKNTATILPSISLPISIIHLFRGSDVCEFCTELDYCLEFDNLSKLKYHYDTLYWYIQLQQKLRFTYTAEELY